MPVTTGVPCSAAGDGEVAASATGVSDATANASIAAKRATLTNTCRLCIGKDLSIGTAAGGP